VLKAVSTPYYRLGKAAVMPGRSVLKAVVKCGVMVGTAWEQVRGIGLTALRELEELGLTVHSDP